MPSENEKIRPHFPRREAGQLLDPELVERIRARIASGYYDSARVVAVVMDRVAHGGARLADG